MSTQQIDYAALAEQARQQAAPKVDYAALAQQARQQSSPAKPLSLYEQARASFNAKKGNVEMPGSFEGHPENMAGYVDTSAGDIGRGAIDIAHGNIAKGGHEVISGTMTGLAPATPFVAAGAPLTFARAAAGGYLTGKVAEGITKEAGGSQDQQAFANDLGNLGGGAIAGSGAIRAFLGSPTKAVLGKAASASEGVISDDLLGIISPRALHGLRLLRAANKVVNSAEDSAGLSEIASKHTDAISKLESQLNDALSKANALPPEAAPPSSQPAAQQKVTPNATIYDEPIAEKSAQDIYREKFLQKKQPPLSLLDQLKQWDQISQIRAQLEDQIGKGQDEVQQWMENHNQQAAGGKSTAAAKLAAAKAKLKTVQADAEGKVGAVPTGEAPTVAYRMRDAGEKGIMPNAGKTAQASLDPAKVQSYGPGRAAAQNHPQEMVKVDLTKLNPSEYSIEPNGYVKFKSAVPESFIEKMGEQPQVPDPNDPNAIEMLLRRSLQRAQANKAMSAGAD